MNRLYSNRPFITLVIVLLIVLLGIKIANANTPIVFTNPPKHIDYITTNEIIDNMNKDRASVSLSPLTETPQLDASARDKCRDEAINNYYAHVSPSGVDPWSFINNYVQFKAAGENLAEDFNYATNVEQKWLSSPGHRANILNPNFTETGVAKCKRHGKTEIVVHFIQPL